MLTLKEISTQTGLDLDFLRRLVKALEPTLTTFIERGEKNTILLDTAAIGVIDRAKELKQAGKTLSSICKTIENESKQPETVSHKQVQTNTNPNKQSQSQELKEAIEARYKAELETKEARFESLQNEFKLFKSTILLFTDGKGTDLQSITISKEKEAVTKGKRLALYEELRGLGFWQGGKKKNILHRLEKLENGDKKTSKAA